METKRNKRVVEDIATFLLNSIAEDGVVKKPAKLALKRIEERAGEIPEPWPKKQRGKRCSKA